MKKFTFALFFVLLLCSRGYCNSPEFFESTETYKVFGTDEQSIRNSMNANSPCKQDGKTFDAFTTWYVRWHFQWRNHDGKYKISKAGSNVEIKFVLPDWQDRNRAPAALQEKWNNYYKALVEHEKGHAKIGREAAAAVIRAIMDVPPQSSGDQVSRAANAAANRVLERYRTEEREYDRKTRHGMKTGAVFP